ncbi:hypothetical protein [Candidatus Planktophila dulcis]|uniref:hypothetical protein n=1 Tax=Candidatus Planktophila dulcis TaxID=1884914 RepID=UPI003CEDA856
MHNEVGDQWKKMNTQESIVIVGIVKDAGASLANDLLRLELAFADFAEIHWFLVESNSSDNTVEVLDQVKNRKEKFDFVSLGNLGKPEESRTIRMAIARNRYLDEIQSQTRYSKTDYVVVADFNHSNSDLTIESVRSCFTTTNWDVCSANQDGPYYDIWALRHELWQPNDCWRQLEFFKRYVKFPEKALFMAVNSKMITIPRNSSWIEVESAFGGLGIYRSQIITQANYRGVDIQGLPVCEHVPLHQELASKGYRLFINPSLINIGRNDHSERKSWIKIFIRILKYPIKYVRLKREFRSDTV